MNRLVFLGVVALGLVGCAGGSDETVDGNDAASTVVDQQTLDYRRDVSTLKRGTITFKSELRFESNTAAAVSRRDVTTLQSGRQTMRCRAEMPVAPGSPRIIAPGTVEQIFDAKLEAKDSAALANSYRVYAADSLYAGTNTSSRRLARLRDGDWVTVLGSYSQGQWVQVRVDGTNQEGFLNPEILDVGFDPRHVRLTLADKNGDAADFSVVCRWVDIYSPEPFSAGQIIEALGTDAAYAPAGAAPAGPIKGPEPEPTK